MLAEPLIFEISDRERTGVDFPLEEPLSFRGGAGGGQRANKWPRR